MTVTNILIELDYEYNINTRLGMSYFNKWIETGEDIYKEKELWHYGAASLALRMKECIIKRG